MGAGGGPAASSSSAREYTQADILHSPPGTGEVEALGFEAARQNTQATIVLLGLNGFPAGVFLPAFFGFGPVHHPALIAKPHVRH